MKALFALLATVLLASQAQAGFGFGACPLVTSIPYTSSMGTARAHKLLYVDGFVSQALGWAALVVPQIPSNLNCVDFSALLGANYSYTSAQYQSQFLSTASPLAS